MKSVAEVCYNGEKGGTEKAAFIRISRDAGEVL